MSPEDSISPTEFGRLFATFRQTAFRVEMLPEYSVPEEQEELQRYRAGGYLPNPTFNRDWLDILTAAKHRHAQVSRVRLIPDPLTLYLHFEIHWAYAYSAAAGEVIDLLLPTAPARVLREATKDFWLFDDATAVLLHYGNAGEFLHATRATPSQLSTCRALRPLLLSHTIPLAAFLAQQRAQ